MKRKSFLLAFILTITVSLITNCDSITPSDGDLTDYSCEGCHTNWGALNTVINDLELEEDGGAHAAPG